MLKKNLTFVVFPAHFRRKLPARFLQCPYRQISTCKWAVSTKFLSFVRFIGFVRVIRVDHCRYSNCFRRNCRIKFYDCCNRQFTTYEWAFNTNVKFCFLRRNSQDRRCQRILLLFFFRSSNSLLPITQVHFLYRCLKGAVSICKRAFSTTFLVSDFSELVYVKKSHYYWLFNRRFLSCLLRFY